MDKILRREINTFQITFFLSQFQIKSKININLFTFSNKYYHVKNLNSGSDSNVFIGLKIR